MRRARGPRIRRLLAMLLPAAALLALGGLAFGAVVRVAGPPAERPLRTAAPVAVPVPSSTTTPSTTPAAPRHRPVRYRDTVSLGLPFRGRLRNATVLPSEGRDFVTMSPRTWTLPNAAYRRTGTPKLIRTLLRVLRAHRRARPDAPRVVVGDLSLPRGGPFRAEPGELGEFGRPPSAGGHGSHQNGLDVDVYYPRRDGVELGPQALRQVDRDRAQDLVDRFVDAGAEFVFVGPRLGLRGPRAVVQPLRYHDDHLHLRITPPR